MSKHKTRNYADLCMPRMTLAGLFSGAFGILVPDTSTPGFLRRSDADAMRLDFGMAGDCIWNAMNEFSEEYGKE